VLNPRETIGLLILPGFLAASMLWGACSNDVESVSTATGTTGGSAGTGATGGTGTGGTGTGGTTAGGAGGGGSGPVSCNPNGVVCQTAPPDCNPGDVPSVVAGCWGECVPVLSCAAEDSCANCQGGFCAEYQDWTTEYRCVLPSLQCQAANCTCLGPYLCPAPFDACQDGTMAGPIVICSCPTC
jgi:hypothetical protein